MSYIEVLHANGLTQTQWDNMLYEEYIGQLTMRRWMGTGEGMPIQVKEDLTKKKGDTIVFGLVGQVQGGHVTGATKGRGNEGTLPLFNFSLTVDNVRDLVKIEDVPMTQQRVGFDVLALARRRLAVSASKHLDDDVLLALTTIGAERVRGRYLYGRTDGNWNGTHATALNALSATLDILSVNVIDTAKRKAQIPRNASAKIMPARIKVGKDYEEWFTFWTHPYSMRDLMNNDAAWKNEKLHLTPNSAMSDSVFFTGTAFKGAVRGVLCYEYDRMPLATATGGTTLQYSHSLLLGAQAAVIGWAQRSKFNEEEHDFGHDRSYEQHEIRNVAKCIFNRSTTEDHGLVNVFVPAVAD